MPEFDGKPLQSVAKVDLESEDEKSEAEREEQQKEFADLLAWLKETLNEHVSEVRLSASGPIRQPAITPTFGITPASGAHVRASGQAVPVSKRILELNRSSPACGRRTKLGEDEPSLVETAEFASWHGSAR